VEARVGAINWFHSIDLGNGIITRGKRKPELYRRKIDLTFRHFQPGWSVIDVGAWDGLYSFEAKRRGASRVLATDYHAWAGPGWGTKAGFELAREVTGEDVEDMDIDAMHVTVDRVGQFDMVLGLGLLYHLKHPLLFLEQIAPVCKRLLVLDTHLDMAKVKVPAMAFYPGAEVGGDGSTWVGPNVPCVEAMCKTAGFSKVEHELMSPKRGVFYAFK
jgi:tRNA (mo5U34)-methyltransferase